MSEDCSKCAFVTGHVITRPLPEPGVMVKPEPGQFEPGSTLTVNDLVAALPHWSKAVALTVVIEFFGKQ